jgi:hypothetical protein
VLFTYKETVTEISGGDLHSEELIVPQNNWFPLVEGHLIRHSDENPILLAFLALSLRATCLGRSSCHLDRIERNQNNEISLKKRN